ncbi:MAG: T9SS type A sorting domain-containing protein, partial [Flavobacteriales bacterium]
SFGAGGSDVYVIKIDKNGIIKWEYAYGGALNDFGLSICQSVDSGFLISGSTESFGAGQRDFYVLKIDSIGNLNWSKVFGGTGNETGKSILELDNKDVVVFGNTGSFGRGSDDFYFIKLNSLGDTIMTRNYGGLSIDIGEEIHQTSDKGFIMAGYTNSFNTWSFDAYIVKVDSSGNSGCHQSNTLTQVVTPTSIRTSTNSVITNGIQINDLGVKIGKTLSKAINTCNINSTEEIINKRVITVFPNPTSGIISISFNSEDVDYISKASIIDINGKIIQTKIISNEINQIDISSYQNGFYFLRIETDLGSITKKIIKQ